MSNVGEDKEREPLEKFTNFQMSSLCLTSVNLCLWKTNTHISKVRELILHLFSAALCLILVLMFLTSPHITRYLYKLLHVPPYVSSSVVKHHPSSSSTSSIFTSAQVQKEFTDSSVCLNVKHTEQKSAQWHILCFSVRDKAQSCWKISASYQSESWSFTWTCSRVLTQKDDCGSVSLKRSGSTGGTIATRRTSFPVDLGVWVLG